MSGNRGWEKPKVAPKQQEYVAEPMFNESPLTAVQIDGTALLKIIKHCEDHMPNHVAGSLLGLDVETKLEITNCFALPSGESTDESDFSNAEYQMEMMKMLREVNIDNNCVGWYRSTYLGSFLTPELVDQQYHFQSALGPKATLILFDPYRTKSGVLSIKAYRLRDEFMVEYKKRDAQGMPSLDQASLGRMGSGSIFEEIPVEVHNPSIVSTLLLAMSDSAAEAAPVADSTQGALLSGAGADVEAASDPFLEKNLEFLIDCVEDLSAENSRFIGYQRSLQRQQAAQVQWAQKRAAENEELRAQGKAELVGGEPAQKTYVPPSHFEAVLMSNQIDSYCTQVDAFEGQSFSSLFLSHPVQG